MLFTFIAERYEQRFLGIKPALVFSRKKHIFVNPMSTASAIDPVAHHSVILAFDVPSFRTGVPQPIVKNKGLTGNNNLRISGEDS